MATNSQQSIINRLVSNIISVDPTLDVSPSEPLYTSLLSIAGIFADIYTSIDIQNQQSNIYTAYSSYLDQQLLNFNLSARSAGSAGSGSITITNTTLLPIAIEAGQQFTAGQLTIVSIESATVYPNQPLTIEYQTQTVGSGTLIAVGLKVTPLPDISGIICVVASSLDGSNSETDLQVAIRVVNFWQLKPSIANFQFYKELMLQSNNCTDSYIYFSGKNAFINVFSGYKNITDLLAFPMDNQQYLNLSPLNQVVSACKALLINNLPAFNVIGYIYSPTLYLIPETLDIQISLIATYNLTSKIGNDTVEDYIKKLARTVVINTPIAGISDTEISSSQTFQQQYIRISDFITYINSSLNYQTGTDYQVISNIKINNNDIGLPIPDFNLNFQQLYYDIDYTNIGVSII